MRRVAATPAALALALALAATDAAADDKPFPRGTISGSLGLGGSFGRGRDLNTLSFGAGFLYFLWGGQWNSLGLGLSVDDSVLLYSNAIKSSIAGIEKQTATNIFRITPKAQFTIVRTRWFTPYVIGGVGPTFYNNKGGVGGHWIAGPGAFIGVGGPVFIDVGVNFTGMFPSGHCKDAFRLNGGGPPVLDPTPCGFSWFPRVGLTLAFGVGGSGRGDRKRKRRGHKDPPPWEPSPQLEPPPEVEAQPAPAPQEPPAPPASPIAPTPTPENVPPPAEPDPAPPAQPAAAPTEPADPAPEPVADPAADPAVDPAADPAADPTADPAADPAAKPPASDLAPSTLPDPDPNPPGDAIVAP